MLNPDCPGPAETLIHPGDNRDAVGELAQAKEAWQQGLAIPQTLGHNWPD
jgi:hypothetical protein